MTDKEAIELLRAADESIAKVRSAIASNGDYMNGDYHDGWVQSRIEASLECVGTDLHHAVHWLRFRSGKAK